MDTRRSDSRLRAWEAREGRLESANLTLQRTLRASPETVFPLLCPTREYDWIPTWDCHLMHSTSGLAEHNAIFRTNRQGQDEIWICTHHEPSRAVHYVRIMDGLLTKLEIGLSENGGGTVDVIWSLTVFALDEGKNEEVRSLELGPERRLILEGLLDDLEHYVEKGGMRVRQGA